MTFVFIYTKNVKGGAVVNSGVISQAVDVEHEISAEQSVDILLFVFLFFFFSDFSLLYGGNQSKLNAGGWGRGKKELIKG